MARPLPVRSLRPSSLFAADAARRRSRRDARLLVLSAALACLVAPARGVASAAPRVATRPLTARRRVTPSSTIRLPGHVLPALTNATPAPQAVGTDPIMLTLVLRHDDQAGFERYLHALQNPRSPRYRHFLSQRQVA